MQDLITIELDVIMLDVYRRKRKPPPVSHPRDRYDERKLHHNDPTPVQRAMAPKRRRWRI